MHENGTMQRLCVFTGSNTGMRPTYLDAAHELAAELSREGIELVYGGARVGLMGALADEVLRRGGRVIGVIPTALIEKEIAHTGLSELHTVASMHKRKAKMAELSDGFLALPGGFGTFEEFFEIVTWLQLGLHQKPCGLLNIDGFYDSLCDFLDHAVAEQFVRPEHRAMLTVEKDIKELLYRFKSWQPPSVPKWIDLDRA